MDWTPKTLTIEALSSNKEKKVVMNVHPCTVYLISHFFAQCCKCVCSLLVLLCSRSFFFTPSALIAIEKFRCCFKNTLLDSVTALSAVSASLGEVHSWQVSHSLHAIT